MTEHCRFRSGLLLNLAIMAGGSLVLLATDRLMAEERPEDRRVAERIDAVLGEHWRKHNIVPAGLADDAVFLRRVMLDLTGRIPTPAELTDFEADSDPKKRGRLISRLIDEPEFASHFAHRLDQMIQGRYAGNAEFIGWLEKSLAGGKSWDRMFEQMMLGPWKEPEQKPASRFLDKRAKASDVLANDAARVFFGVDISCAKCHDHPLVADWTQNHYYGMVAFFNRTTGGNGKIGEKAEGEVTFLAGDGKERTAAMMFLSGRRVIEPAFAARKQKQKPPIASRRERLVKLALDDRVFFSRSIVNRLWAEFFGRGLIEPVDQMHSESVPAVPGLLDWLAEDFAATGYDLKRLIRAMVSSRAYQLDSRWDEASPKPDADSFAVARLRPLTRRQLAASLLIATGTNSPGQLDQEKIASLASALDPRIAAFQSSADEALFLSNSPTVQKLFKVEGDNLAGRLAKISDANRLVEEAIRTIFGRDPRPEEGQELAAWIKSQAGDQSQTCEQLVWALATSAEFRFNH